MIDIDSLLAEDVDRRRAAVAACASAPEHERSALAGKVARLARAMAEELATADEAGAATAAHAERLGRAAVALAALRVEVAKSCLHRIAEERSYAVKSALAHALRATDTAEGRSTLVYLLSDDDAQADAIVAIGVAPWPEILPALIEIAEADERAARLAARPIARCGATAGGAAASAAGDFLLEQLDDEMVVIAAADALLRFGAGFPGVLDAGRRLARTEGTRRVVGLCLVAATATNREASGEIDQVLADLAGPRRAADEGAAHAFLKPLREDPSEPVRRAAERTWQALGLDKGS